MFERTGKSDESEQWLSVSDLMAGLMVFFLFIAILYIQPLQRIKINIEEIATTWELSEEQLFQALQEEFSKDLEVWNAELDRDDLTIRFNSPRVLFDPGQSDVRPTFQRILSDFFPRYLKVLEPFVEQELIEEIRIEGHTSSSWGGANEREAYFRNLKLSQDRTRSVLEYSLNLESAEIYLDWARALITANGLSSSRLITDDNGDEDADRSRRVEFRVKTTTEQKLQEILGELDKDDV